MRLPLLRDDVLLLDCLYMLCVFVHDKNFQYVMNFTTQNEVHEIV